MKLTSVLFFVAVAFSTAVTAAPAMRREEIAVAARAPEPEVPPEIETETRDDESEEDAAGMHRPALPTASMPTLSLTFPPF